MKQLATGQRWMSAQEPEQGLGTIKDFSERDVLVEFSATGEQRRYSIENAPLERVIFNPGEELVTDAGEKLVVDKVEEHNGIKIYLCGETVVPELNLSDVISFTHADQRLRRGQIDSNRIFNLRREAAEWNYNIKHSPIHGLTGGKIDLIPHQLFIAEEVALRQSPRVLLADEVGLGKTIEACLVMHRLLITGQIKRVLVLVPESLVHQWFVEMLRRFNHWLAIFDLERMENSLKLNPEINPFFEDQLVICPINLLSENSHVFEQALDGEWDMLIVDEAHHLGWSPEIANTEYTVVEKLAQKIERLLLLTATPEQLGEQSHFARLRLLDPDRFFSYDDYCREVESYTELAKLVDKIQQYKKLTKKDNALLKKLFSHNESELERLLEGRGNKDDKATASLVGELLDQHGTGRVMFRNTRSVVKGFPERVPVIHALENEIGNDLLVNLAAEFANDCNLNNEYKPDFINDPRLEWLVDFLQNNKNEKVLLICRTKEKVLSLEAALREKTSTKVSLFHEDLTLIQRDRNAAYFADENGAQLLLCSEIGSEGRNFQFAHNLILFDLPMNPELIEQRIGRLDRIGQKCDIKIHLPVVKNSPQAIVAKWYHEGLNAFTECLEDGHSVLEKFGEKVIDIAMKECCAVALKKLIAETKEFHVVHKQRLEEGRDRLLEMNSYKKDVADGIVKKIKHLDDERDLEKFSLRLFEHFGLEVEEREHRTYVLKPDNLTTDTFPNIPDEGMMGSFDRKKVLAREDYTFLNCDQPLLTGAIEALLNSEQGNSCIATWHDKQNQAMLLEAFFVVEAIAAPHLHVDRFLPLTPVRVVVNHKGLDCTDELSQELLARHCQDDPYSPIAGNTKIMEQLLPEMVEFARKSAAVLAKNICLQARKDMRNFLVPEIERLQQLRNVNKSVREDEISGIEDSVQKLEQVIADSRLRLDSLRLIWRG